MTVVLLPYHFSGCYHTTVHFTHCTQYWIQSKNRFGCMNQIFPELVSISTEYNYLCRLCLRMWCLVTWWEVPWVRWSCSRHGLAKIQRRLRTVVWCRSSAVICTSSELPACTFIVQRFVCHSSPTSFITGASCAFHFLELNLLRCFDWGVKPIQLTYTDTQCFNFHFSSEPGLAGYPLDF